MKQRNWSPWHDLPLDEMHARGHQVSEDTITLIELLRREEYVGDYVQVGLEMFHAPHSPQHAFTVGRGKRRSTAALALVLQHSQARTEEQLTAYVDKVHSTQWKPQQHSGVDTPLGAPSMQWCRTGDLFPLSKLRSRIRHEYGLPQNPTPEERQRGYEIGASEAFRVVGQDEIAHYGLFLRIVQSALKYLPSLTCDVLTRVLAGFEMPAFRLLPNSRVLLRSVKRTNLYNSVIHREKVHNPILNSLGLDDQQAFEKAARLSHTLPEHSSPESTTLSRTGEWQISPA
jgi:acyl-[acyl-carrier-protein] desaturase